MYIMKSSVETDHQYSWLDALDANILTAEWMYTEHEDLDMRVINDHICGFQMLHITYLVKEVVKHVQSSEQHRDKEHMV